MDRFDLYVESEEVNHSELLTTDTTTGGEAAVLHRIEAARNHQKERYKSPSLLNSDMTNSAIRTSVTMSTEAEQLLNRAASNLRLSARSYMKTIKVAQTITDLDSSRTITVLHMSEALQYRNQHPAAY